MIRERSYGGRRSSESSKSGRRRRRSNRKSCPAFPGNPKKIEDNFIRDSVDLRKRRLEKNGRSKYRAARYGAHTAIPTAAVNPISEFYQQVQLSPQSYVPRDDSRRKSSARRATPRQSTPKPGPSNRRLSSSQKFGSPLLEKDDVFDDKETSTYLAECSFMKYHPSLLRNEYYRSPRRSSEDYPEFGARRTQDMDEDGVVPVTDFGGFDNPDFSPVVLSQNRRTSQREIPSAPGSSMKIMEESFSPWRFRDVAPQSRNRFGSDDLSSSYVAPRITSTPTPALQPQGPIPRSYLGRNVPDKEIYRQQFQPLSAPVEQSSRDFVIYEVENDPWADFQAPAENAGPSARRNVQTTQRRPSNAENNRNRRQSVDNVDRSHRRMSLLKAPLPEKRARRKSYLASDGCAVSTVNNSTANSEDVNSLDGGPLTDDEK